jgi:tetratricopeptide (TPR) repeat protein
MRGYLNVLIIAASLGLPPLAMGSGGGGGAGSGNGMISTDGAVHTRNQVAKEAYLSAVRSINAAKGYDADAAKASTPEKSAKAQAKAQKYYQEALTKLIDVVGLDPKMVEAWNYLGFTNRKLGRYEESLDSYAKALELNPNYPQALEYRGEAYLGLNQIEDAKTAYMALFPNSRPLAEELMAAMHLWTDARRKDAQGLSPEEVESFAQWIDERARIAAQTASLATGAAPNWR